MKSYILTIILLFLMSGVLFAEDTQPNSRESSENKTERTEIRRGNKEYKSDNYVGSEIDYRKALDSNPSSLTATYNLGNSLYKQGKYSDAIKEYEKVVMSETDDKKLSEAWHNLGNSYFMEKNLPKSIEAYKNSLRINPKDDDARYNLRMAQLLLEQNQQDQQQQQDQNKDKQNKDQQQQQQQQQPNKDQQNKNKNQLQQTNMSQENAQQILDAMQQDERNTQEKVRKALMEQRQRRRTDKEW